MFLYKTREALAIEQTVMDYHFLYFHLKYFSIRIFLLIASMAWHLTYKNFFFGR